MVSFNCEGCNDVVKKPKLDQHYYKCHSPVTCLDCSTLFSSPPEWKSHTTCVSEAEKYEKSVYKGNGKKPKKADKGTLEAVKPKEDEESASKPALKARKSVDAVEAELQVKRDDDVPASDQKEKKDKKEKKERKDKKDSQILNNSGEEVKEPVEQKSKDKKEKKKSKKEKKGEKSMEQMDEVAKAEKGTTEVEKEGPFLQAKEGQIKESGEEKKQKKEKSHKKSKKDKKIKGEEAKAEDSVMENLTSKKDDVEKSEVDTQAETPAKKEKKEKKSKKDKKNKEESLKIDKIDSSNTVGVEHPAKENDVEMKEIELPTKVPADGLVEENSVAKKEKTSKEGKTKKEKRKRSSQAGKSEDKASIVNSASVAEPVEERMAKAKVEDPKVTVNDAVVTAKSNLDGEKAAKKEKLGKKDKKYKEGKEKRELKRKLAGLSGQAIKKRKH